MTLDSWNNVVANFMCSHAGLAAELAERMAGGSDITTIAYDLQILGAIIDIFDEYEIDYRDGTYTATGDINAGGGYIKIHEDNIDITMLEAGTILTTSYGTYTIDYIFYVANYYYIYPVETVTNTDTDIDISFTYTSEAVNCLTIAEMAVLGNVANKISQTSWNIDYYLDLNTLEYVA